MKTETTTIITENDVGSGFDTLTIEIRHDPDLEYGFVAKLGCEEIVLTSSDLRWMVKCFNAALRIRKAAAT